MVFLIIFLTILLIVVFLWGICLNRKNQKLQECLQISEQKREEEKRDNRLQDAMLPSQLLALFQNGELEKIRLGEEKNIQAAVLSFNVAGFSDWIRSQTAEEIFIFVDHILKHVVPSVLFQEGEVEHFANAGLRAFFQKNPERALLAAISVCEVMNQNGYEKLQYTIGMSYGMVMVGMVGDERRFGVLTLSETTGIAEFLQEIGGEYGARVLISGSMKQHIFDFEKKYNSRYLGCIYIKAADVMEDLYDVFDGDDLSNRNGKRKTKLLFEKGVELFQKKKFYDARLHFIEVLKANRMDGAAKKYLYFCNQYLGLEDVTEAAIYIEVY